MGELWERLARYDKENRAYTLWELEEFKTMIIEEVINIKCLPCFEMGLRYCSYWKTGANCEEFEVGVVEELLGRFK